MTIYIQTSKRVTTLKQEITKISTLQEEARFVSRQFAQVQTLNAEISHLEAQLMSTGSTKTADEVRAEIDDLKAQLCV